MTDRVLFECDGPIALITNNNPDKHNAFDEEMDEQLFEIFDELRGRSDIRAVIWRGEGKSFSSGRDVSAIGSHTMPRTHHEMMLQGHRATQHIFEIDAPIIVAIKGWAMGGSFQRALLCDIRVAAEGSRFRLPELTHGVIPDTGGVSRLFQMCGHGVTSDLVLTGRVMDAQEAYQHGIVSRLVAPEALDDTVWEIARQVVSAPFASVKMARRVIQQLGEPEVRASMNVEMIGQTFVNKSDDFAEFRAARAEDREPRYTGS